MAFDFDEITDIPHKLLVWGGSGAGKTRALVMPRPGTDGSDVAICLCEKNGIPTVKAVNPKARIKLATNIDDVAAFTEAAASGELREQYGIRRIVYDGATEIQRLMKDRILGLDKDPDRELSAEEEADLDARMSQQDWGDLTESMRRFMRKVRNLDYVTGISALEVELNLDGEGKPLHLRPSFEGKKLPNEVAQYFSAVAYLYRTEKVGRDGLRQVDYHAMFDGSSRWIVKPSGNLRGIVAPNMGEWLEVLDGKTEAAQVKADAPGPAATGSGEKEKGSGEEPESGRGGRRRSSSSRAKKGEAEQGDGKKRSTAQSLRG